MSQISSGSSSKSRRPLNTAVSAHNSAQASLPSTPTETTKVDLDSLKFSTLDEGNTGSNLQSRTKSFLNLTSSTLFGIYQPTGYDTYRDDSTPWGTGAQTPIERSRPASFDLTNSPRPDANRIVFERRLQAHQRGIDDAKARRRKSSASRKQRYTTRKGFKGFVLPLILRDASLFGLGMLFGLLITQLHGARGIVPVKLDINRSSWSYLLVWGAAGIALGEALPWVDRIWAQLLDDSEAEDVAEDTINTSNTPTHEEPETAAEDNSRGVGAWNDVVRSIGLFVGIAFAVRRLPWQSTLQLSLTLALTNPALWYIIDRSPPGFILSALVAIGGTALVMTVQPTWLPPPASFSNVYNAMSMGLPHNSTEFGIPERLVLGVFTHEFVGTVTWIASVLFVSTVCFGNIGRRLAGRNL